MLSFGSSVKKMAEEAPSLNLSFFLFFSRLLSFVYLGLCPQHMEVPQAEG